MSTEQIETIDEKNLVNMGSGIGNDLSTDDSKECESADKIDEFVPLPKMISEAPAKSSNNYQENSIELSLFDRLPIELQYKILSYLTPAELCCSVAPVCKRWKQLAYEPILWQRLQIFGRTLSSDTVNHVLHRAPLVRHLGLYHFTDVWQFASSLAYCTMLISLDLNGCGGINAAFISTLSQCCPMLEVLSVEGCRTVDYDAVVQMSAWNRLRNLSLAHCPAVDDKSIIFLSKRCVHIQTLNIDGITSITDNAILVLAEERKHNLRRLFLDGDQLTDIAYQALIKCTLLIELSVSYAELISDKGLMAVKQLKYLQHLKIRRGMELSESGLKAIFEDDTLSNLTLLDLSNCSSFNDDGVDAMTRCCSKLKNLGLAWCWDISDRGLETVVDRCRSLEGLDIIGLVKITGACLCKIPESLPNLVYLDLQQCSRIIDEVIEEVVRQKPNLKAFNYYGDKFGSL